ncbi:hypothetical protein PRUPE_6G078400 [Prunus persica]|uniref:Uncharacterized protein n=1 Tax=Prunus persica TaxID=3760 RepID=A0A251NLV0_PRUPE|nr:hypothetical protein PRUPE_6G078400 [Prunus persica]
MPSSPSSPPNLFSLMTTTRKPHTDPSLFATTATRKTQNHLSLPSLSDHHHQTHNQPPETQSNHHHHPIQQPSSPN